MPRIQAFGCWESSITQEHKTVWMQRQISKQWKTLSLTTFWFTNGVREIVKDYFLQIWDIIKDVYVGVSDVTAPQATLVQFASTQKASSSSEHDRVLPTKWEGRLDCYISNTHCTIWYLQKIKICYFFLYKWITPLHGGLSHKHPETSVWWSQS